MGDRGASSEGEMFIYNVERFYNKWLWDIQNGQHLDGDISDVNPPYWAVYNHDVTWPGTFIMVADHLYLQYGETAQIRQHYAAMARWIDYQMKSVHDGIDPNGGFGDWDPPPHAHSTNVSSHDPNRSTPGPLIATSSMYKYLLIMVRFAGLLHKPADQRRWLADARKLYAGFQTMWDAKGGYYGNGSDTSCILPLAVGIVPAARQAAVEHRLAWLIRRHQRGHLYCGLIGMQWACAALSRIHETPLAWTWLNKTTYPSYGYMITHGATTLWENWNGNTAGSGMNSMNHVMFIGDTLTWLYQDLGGIKAAPAAPGFKRIIMRPHLERNLTWVKCFHRSPYGKIVSDWKITANRQFLWQVEIPANSSALVEIPTRSAAAVRLNSRPLSNKSWIKYVRMTKGRAIYQVQSGRYNFSAPLPHF
jgi:alpha-L-rhamnosidase